MTDPTADPDYRPGMEDDPTADPVIGPDDGDDGLGARAEYVKVDRCGMHGKLQDQFRLLRCRLLSAQNCLPAAAVKCSSSFHRCVHACNDTTNRTSVLQPPEGSPVPGTVTPKAGSICIK